MICLWFAYGFLSGVYDLFMVCLCFGGGVYGSFMFF